MYIIVTARRDGDNREHGAVFYGIRSKAVAVDRFLTEFPAFRSDEWEIDAKFYEH